MKHLKKMNENNRDIPIHGAKLKYKMERVIEVQDWDRLVQDTYKRTYSFQQQEGCQSRGSFHISIPSDYTNDEEMNDSIPEVVNGEEMGVKFDVWLQREPNQPVNGETDYHLDLFWERNFYPDIHTVANDLYNKGLVEAGDY